MRKFERLAEEKGIGLLELVATMPLIVLLSVALGTAFVFGVRAYAYVLSDWVLQEQVSYAMERMVTDLRYAVDAEAEENTLRIRCRDVSNSLEWVEYKKTTEAQPRIRRKNQPLTGQSTLGQIVMEHFSAEMPRDRLVILRLAGKNLLTGQTYELETAVVLMGKAP